VSMAVDGGAVTDVPSPERWQELLRVVKQVQERNRELEEGMVIRNPYAQQSSKLSIYSHNQHSNPPNRQSPNTSPASIPSNKPYSSCAGRWAAADTSRPARGSSV
jgi:hypothetical protein